MLFQSFEFLALLGVVLLATPLLGRKGQNALLLLASAVFYGWVHPWFLGLLLISTLTDYGCALALERRPDRRRLWVGVSLAVNLGLLGLFKYFGFFVDNAVAAGDLLGLSLPRPALQLILPVGISFYTFQTLSYTLDVAAGRIKACRSLLDHAVFVSFFPQLVAGPIERAGRLLPQLQRRRQPGARDLAEGVLLLVWGFFKKLVIADNVSADADRVFSLADPTFPELWVGVLAFGVQILADFSAYTDIARGCARMLGVRLSENFDHPYLATGPGDFWRRWHISLSTWFRDYVYIPLGGSRGSARRTAANIIVVFLVSGLWHGASWNFVLWGAWWGALVVVARPLSALVPPRILESPFVWPLRVAGTFVLTHIGWLLFREQDLGWLARHLALSPADATLQHWQMAGWLLVHVLVCASPLVAHALADAATRRAWPDPSARADRTLLWRAAACGLLFVGILTLRSSRGPDFLYFQF